MNIKDLEKLVKLLENSQLSKILIEENGTKFELTKSSCEQPREIIHQAAEVPRVLTSPVVSEPVPVKAEKIEVKGDFVTAPMVGTFYLSSSPTAEPFIKVGDKIKAGDVVCIIEAMKLFNEIESTLSGEVLELLVKNGEVVEYGQPLFKIKTA